MLRLYLAAIIAALATLALVLGRAPLALGAVYVIAGAVSFLVYRHDKLAAAQGAWRVPEAVLLAIDLVGGIVGGLMAREVLRHKTRKQPFSALDTAIGIGHAVVLATLMIGLWGFPQLG
ncbi:DUF1294 domain-containing protein [Devosia sp.]|uniref:DUF1294 domain-containing protein n=1 Tax=Devosia sp. TaxID=1871048 RepID=UPI003A8D868A